MFCLKLLNDWSETNHPDTLIMHVKFNERKKRSLNLFRPERDIIPVTLLNLVSLDIVPQFISQHWDHCLTLNIAAIVRSSSDLIITFDV